MSFHFVLYIRVCVFSGAYLCFLRIFLVHCWERCLCRSKKSCWKRRALTYLEKLATGEPDVAEDNGGPGFSQLLPWGSQAKTRPASHKSSVSLHAEGLIIFKKIANPNKD